VGRERDRNLNAWRAVYSPQLAKPRGRLGLLESFDLTSEPMPLRDSVKTSLAIVVTKCGARWRAAILFDDSRRATVPDYAPDSPRTNKVI